MEGENDLIPKVSRRKSSKIHL